MSRVTLFCLNGTTWLSLVRTMSGSVPAASWANSFWSYAPSADDRSSLIVMLSCFFWKLPMRVSQTFFSAVPVHDVAIEIATGPVEADWAWAAGAVVDAGAGAVGAAVGVGGALEQAV